MYYSLEIHHFRGGRLVCILLEVAYGQKILYKSMKLDKDEYLRMKPSTS